ncbi:IS30 family transposase [Peptostreptococcus russellii]|uniref:IS30 family transposase n=1 Tax=Peptostreptococcus russellii TaxID=215200 RepID=UPI0029422041|nr:IS30 family transposase [Peptostreptococcus russellii]
MSYKHLTIKERNKIEVLSEEGYSSRKISKILGYHHSTIARELNRCKDKYKAEKAQENKEKLNSKKGRPLKITKELEEKIISKLEEKWSPEQIVGRLLKGSLSFKTIYNWIYKDVIKFDISKLRRKGKSRKPQENRGKFNIGKSISNRPKEIKERKTFGHWELDTIVSSRGKSKGCLATFVEMKSRFYVAIPMKNRSKDSIYEAILTLVNTLPKTAFKSFTSDRGKEFARYKDIEKLDIDFYFADAYSAWQRGSNENSNGLLREYYPKKTDLSKISISELIYNLMELNNRPRKCLDYQTPFEILLHELNSI